METANGELKEENLRNIVSLVTSLQETAEELGEEVSILFQQRFFQLLTPTHMYTQTQQEGEVSHFYKQHFYRVMTAYQV